MKKVPSFAPSGSSGRDRTEPRPRTGVPSGWANSLERKLLWGAVVISLAFQMESLFEGKLALRFEHRIEQLEQRVGELEGVTESE
jgi:hypothetical protein